MDDLRNKKYIKFDYTSRYASTPTYYNIRDNKEITGVGKNVRKDIDCILHTVSSTDTLDKLALTYYNNPSYWWIIAYFNDIQDAFVHLSSHYKTLKIPSISNLVFEELR